MAPSVVLAATAEKGGVTGLHGVDLVLASLGVGVCHAAVAFSRLLRETRLALRPLEVWIAAFDALVVLSLGATILMVVVLGGFAEQHAVLVNRGWDVVWLWVGVLLVAVALAQLTGRAVFRWLEAERTPSSSWPAACSADSVTRSDARRARRAG